MKVVFYLMFIFLSNSLFAEVYAKLSSINSIIGYDSCYLVKYTLWYDNNTDIPNDDIKIGTYTAIVGDCDDGKNSIAGEEEISLKDFDNLIIYPNTSTAILYKKRKLYITYFWSDNDTPTDVTDDKLLGYDAIIDYGDRNIIANEENNNILLNPYLSKNLPEREFRKILGLDKPITYSQFRKKQKELYNKLKDLVGKEIDINTKMGKPIHTIKIK